MKCKHGCLIFKLTNCCIVTISTILLWIFYAKSWEGIENIKGVIYEIDTSSIADYDDLDQKKDNLAIFHYNYSYNNETFTGQYDICETNSGLKLHLDQHPVNSPVTIYIKPNNPSESAIDDDYFSDKWCLGFGITFSLGLLLLTTYFTCGYEELSDELKEMFAEKVTESFSVGMGKL